MTLGYGAGYWDAALEWSQRVTGEAVEFVDDGDTMVTTASFCARLIADLEAFLAGDTTSTLRIYSDAVPGWARLNRVGRGDLGGQLRGSVLLKTDRTSNGGRRRRQE